MQIRIGKNRYYERDEKASPIKSSCLKRKIVLSTFLIIISSCTTFFKKSNSKISVNELKNSLNQICLTGEGRGRVQFFQEKHLFGQESLYSKKEKEWILALEIPIHGEEVIRLNWENALEKTGPKIEGAFFNRLKQVAKKQKRGKLYLQLLNSFFKKYSDFLYFLSLDKSEKELGALCKPIGKFQSSGLSCEYKNLKFIWKKSGGGRYQFDIDKKHIFTIDMEKLEKDKYLINKLALSRRDANGAAGHLVKLDLFYESCGN